MAQRSTGSFIHLGLEQYPSRIISTRRRGDFHQSIHYRFQHNAPAQHRQPPHSKSETCVHRSLSSSLPQCHPTRTATEHSGRSATERSGSSAAEHSGRTATGHSGRTATEHSRRWHCWHCYMLVVLLQGMLLALLQSMLCSI